MRRKISLYIGDLLADLDDQSLVLLTYTAEDTKNPATVLNSYSRQLVLPGTGRNAAIFGHYGRVDRAIDRGSAYATGTGYTPTQRTAFAIYDERGEILEAGYVRLDRVAKSGGIVRGYHVTLFGGLGSFFSALSWRDGGDKLTLADLPFMGWSERSMDFEISRTIVQQAWNQLGTPGDTGIFKTINFAPCYNGIPANFSADKALIVPSDVGLPSSQTKGGKTYTLKVGTSHAIATFSQAVDEWAAKDLRSYLQRPVLSVRALFKAAKDYMAARGWTFNYDGIPNFDAWITLPQLNAIAFTSESDSSLSTSSPGTTSPIVGTITASPALPQGVNVKLSADFYLTFQVAGFTSPNTPKYIGLPDATGKRPFTAVFFQVLALDIQDNIVGGSTVFAFAPALQRTWTPRQLAEVCEFVPAWASGTADTYAEAVSDPSFSGGGNLFDTDIIQTVFTAPGADHFTVRVMAYEFAENYDGSIVFVPRPDEEYGADPVFYDAAGTSHQATATYVTLDDYALQVSGGQVRSNALITKRMLLSGGHTPAEYIISFAKIHGLSFLVDGPQKVVDLVTRNDFFQAETIDLTGRVDTSREMSVAPVALSAKWYDFVLEGDSARFWDKYLSDYGRTYGGQRVNTGYDFNETVANLLAGNAFRGAATILDYGQFWNQITEGGKVKPSPFILADNRYQLFTGDDESSDFEVPVPTGDATVNYTNPTNRGYDCAPCGRLEFRDKDNKPTNGRDVLVYYNGKTTMTGFKLSDDDADMNRLNGGQPCWIMGPGTALAVPNFGRYKVSQSVTDSLDFGVPAELGIPGLYYPDDASLYAKGWRAYLADRFDADTKVLHCYVDFGAIQVGPELLRKFYFFDGALWVLNKIVNYSLTTWDPVECEFIQVQDPAAYTSGQNF